MSKRVFLIVLDSFGIGAMPDAEAFGDVDVNTIRSVASSVEFDVPVMAQMGLFNIEGVSCRPAAVSPTAAFARLAERSKGKDTTVGHWELAGLVSPKAFPTYPDGFPADVIKKFEDKVGRRTVCNKPYSGTEVIADYGKHHVETGDLIVYTSADSVFQVAAHEEVVPLKELYDICQTARDMLTASGEHAVGRVIARPFVGGADTGFVRTENRHDYSLAPPNRTMLDYISAAGLETIGVGKIYDIFSGRGISRSVASKNNDEGMAAACELVKSDFAGLAFINLVDFDMLYGHRNNINGYAMALTSFDKKLGDFVKYLKDDDMLIITADHGCDPGDVVSTDHTREYVPMLAFGKPAKSTNLDTRDSFADVAATICDYLEVDAPENGESFWNNIRNNE
jgi:phosphopentomutase